MRRRHEVAECGSVDRRAREDRRLLVKCGAPVRRGQGAVLQRIWLPSRELGQLAQALREHGQRHEITKVKQTAFGPRYEVDGPLPAPDGRRPLLRTVWQMDRGKLAPRLITAYPLEGVEP